MKFYLESYFYFPAVNYYFNMYRSAVYITLPWKTLLFLIHMLNKNEAPETFVLPVIEIEYIFMQKVSCKKIVKF